MEKYRTLEKTKEEAKKWSHIASEAIKNLPNNNITNLLGQITDVILKRSS